MSKAFLYLLPGLWLLQACAPPGGGNAVFSDIDRNAIDVYCECVRPYAALTLMVMMKDTGTTDVGQLEQDLDGLSKKFEGCAKYLKDLESKAEADTIFEKDMIHYVLAERAECSLFILGDRN